MDKDGKVEVKLQVSGYTSQYEATSAQVLVDNGGIALGGGLTGTRALSAHRVAACVLLQDS